VGGKTAAEVTWQDLNDPNLTVEQRKQLADSLSAQDGLRPYALDGTGLISPLSKDNTGQEMRFKMQHTLDITDDIYFNQQLQYREYDTDFTRQTGAYNYVYWERNGQINQSPRGPLLEDGVLYPFAARRQEYRQVDAQEQSWQYFADLSYQFQVAGFEHELLVNANVEDRQIRSKRYSIYDRDKKIYNADNELIYQGQLDYIYDIRNPNFNQGQFENYDPLLTSNYKKGIRAWGIGIQDVAYWGDSFITRVGVAFNTIGQSYQHLGVDARYSASRAQEKPQADTSDNGVTYNLGATYLINDDISLFANHAKGRTAYSVLGSINSDESRREDSTSVSNDIGLRFKALDDQLLASIIVFDSGNTNLRYANPEFEAGVTPDEPEYFYNGEEKTKGIEIDLNAHINNQWLINLNGMVQDARDKKNPNNDSYNTRQKGIPRVSGSAWVSYELSTENPLTLSLGAEYVDKRTINSAGFGVPDAELPSYTIMNSSIRYEWQDVTLKLNINNIFDTHYYQKALFLGGLPGEPRNASFTIQYQI
jgi:outer membrane receptor protein involved in Fe transport